MRTFYLPESSLSLASAELRESMRRWHWHRYFVLLRQEAVALKAGWRDLAVRKHVAAMQHRLLALSVQTALPGEPRSTRTRRRA